MTTMMMAAALLLVPLPAVQMQDAPPVETAVSDPARLDAATRAVAALVPDGVYQRMMRDQFPAMMDAMTAEMMGMDASEFGGAAADGSMRDVAAANDPAFEERMRIMAGVMGEEMGALMSSLEPRVRTGLSRAFAARFTVVQLDDMNAFFATPSGSAFAREYLTLFADPLVMREMAAAAPEMMRAMPAIMKKVEAATAHLPPAPDMSQAAVEPEAEAEEIDPASPAAPSEAIEE